MKKTCLLLLFGICLSSFLTAQTKIDSLLRVLKKPLTEQHRADIYNLLADKFLARNLDTSKHFANEAKKLAIKIGYTDGVIKSVQSLSYVYLNKSLFDSALMLSNNAIDLCKEKDRKTLLGTSYSLKARIFECQNYLDSSELFFNLAIEAANKEPDKFALASIHNNYANLLLSKSDYDKALEYYLKALAFFREAGERGKTATVISNIGNIYSFKKQSEQALEQFNEALTINSSLNNFSAMATNYSNLGVTYRNLEQYDKSIDNQQKALDINIRLGKKAEQIQCLYNLGVTYNSKKEYDKALKYYQESMDLSKKIGFVIGVLYNTYGMGLSYSKLNDRNRAENYLKEALKLSEQLQTSEAKLNCFQELYRLNKRFGNFYESLSFYEKYQMLKDSMFTADKERVAADLQTKYETGKKEAIISRLKHKEEVNQLTLRIGILLFVLLLVGSIFIIFYYQKGKVIYRQKLTIQKQELDKMQMLAEAHKQELTSKALMLAKSEEIILQFKGELEQVLPKVDPSAIGDIKAILKRVQWNGNGKEQWKDFITRFDELNNGFLGKLIELYPNLSPVELRLCAMLRLQLSTKELADLTNRSIRTIENTRTNIRKKMNLDSSENLTTYLLNI